MKTQALQSGSGLLVAVLLATGLVACRRQESVAAIPAPAAPRAELQYDARPVGDQPPGRPIITHVLIADLDQDGLPDIIACDAQSDSVRWLRQAPRGTFTERAIGDPVPGPAHAEVCDLNGDGKLDVLVASMGVVMPNNDKIGSVVVLENLGDGKFRNHVLAEKIARVTDVRGADFNGDGRTDLVVGQFGYVEGEIRWMENLGDWQFRSHVLRSEPGTIHTPVADFDGDGRLDFAALISQDAEAVHLFRGDGRGGFQDDLLWNSPNPGWGSSGLAAADLNRDGRPDLIVTNGDAFDGDANLPPWHGLQWLQNIGGGFKYHRIGDLAGCYSPVCADLNGDGYTDIVTTSAFNTWRDPAAVSLMAWLNDGHENFRPVVLGHTPTHLITAAVGDLDGDGVPEIVTGGFNVYPPYTEIGRITLWTRRPGR